MKPKTMILMFLAVGCGLLATIGVRSYLQTQQVAYAAQTPTETTTIVLARADIPLATQLSKDMLQEANWPKHLWPRGAVADADKLVGRATRCPIFAGEPVVTAKLADEGAQQGLAAVIPKGMRAITVKVNEFSGVAGFLQPGAHVDVLVVVPRRSETIATVSRTIIQDVRVLAVDQKLQRGEKESQIVDAVTLLVTPEQAERLSLACNQGKLHLVMRSNTDADVAVTPGVSLAKLVAETPAHDGMNEAAKRLLKRLAEDRERKAGEDSRAPVAQSQPTPVRKAYVVEEIRGTVVTYNTIGEPTDRSERTERSGTPRRATSSGQSP